MVVSSFTSSSTSPRSSPPCTTQHIVPLEPSEVAADHGGLHQHVGPPLLLGRPDELLPGLVRLAGLAADDVQGPHEDPRHRLEEVQEELGVLITFSSPFCFLYFSVTKQLTEGISYEESNTATNLSLGENI